MKEAELRQRATCSRCKNKLGAPMVPVFTVLRRRDYIINLEAVLRQQGLGIAFGGTLAMHMGPDEDMATPAAEETDQTLCALCRAKFEEWLDNAPAL